MAIQDREGAGSESRRPADAEAESPEPTAVVGIGASAGGLKALREFFRHVPPDSGLAFVVVVHLSPEHESHLADLLQPSASIPVGQVTETMRLEPNRAYVISPGRNLSAIDTHLRASDMEERRRDRAPIDHFFRTLADTYRGNSVGVVLSGTGGDGTQGLRRIRESGGLAIAQDPDEADHDGMPRSAITMGAVDLILPLREIPGAVVEFAGLEPRVPIPAEGREGPAGSLEPLQKILLRLRARTGHDFTRYKTSTLLRRVRRRMQVAKVEELEDYAERLRSSREEADALIADLLITVTGFFRDPEVFDELARGVIPRLFDDKGGADTVRVWSVGCATGEEAYSLAMLLLEEAGRRAHPPDVQIFASDLHERSLRHAREGVYPDAIAADVSPERLDRFFVPENGSYRITDDVREKVIFASHNILRDPPFSRQDLVSCRNVLIYLKRDVQREVVRLFHYALRGEGYLLLGSAESVDHAELFRPEHKHLCLYRRRDVQASDLSLPVFPRESRSLADDSAATPRRRRASVPSYGALHELMVERYAPPSVLVNEEHNVVHVSENAGRYLEHAGGTPTSNIFRIVREELRIELRSALQSARTEGRVVRTRPIPVDLGGELRKVLLRVSPPGRDEVEDLVLIVFDEIYDEDVVPRPAPADRDATVRELEVELEVTKKRLQTIIEEYESSQEEMRASNEELQSTNEEFRSTMEELETSREELQSINEELQTVNQENKHKVEELAQLSSDLQNLLQATDIGTLFLDGQLRIVRFTPRVGEIFNVRRSDRGRPISDLTHRLGYDDLTGDARRVLDTLVTVEREVASDDGHWHLVRVLPYRTPDDRIDGVVLTFVDITALKRSEEARRRSDERYRLLMENVGEYAIFMLDPEGRIATWNAGASNIFGYTEEEALGRPASIVFPDEDPDAAHLELETAAEHGTATDERWHVRADGSRFWSSGVTTALHEPDGTLRGFAKVLRDNTERKAAEDALRRLNESLEERVQARTADVRDVTSRLTMAEHRERGRISRILHDDVQQLLYGVRMRMSLVRKYIDEENGAALLDQVEQADTWLADAIAKTRQLSIDLSPPVLEGEGLAEALGWLQTQMRELHGLDVELRQRGEPRPLPQDMRVLLFQVVRELLFNVRKHAEVSEARVEVRWGERSVEIDVADSGRGMDRGRIEERIRASAANFGLYSARERLALFGGALEVDSEPGSGTRVRVHVDAGQAAREQEHEATQA